MPTLRDLVPDIDPIDPIEVANAGRRRLLRHRVFGAGAAAVVAVAAVTVATQLVPVRDQAVLATTATPSATGSRLVTSHPSTSTDRSAGSPTSFPAGCPSPKSTPGFVEIPAYTAMLYWHGKIYTQTDEPGTPGERLGTVPCNIVEIQDRARRVWDGPWPNGSSTIGKVGAPIHVQQGSDPNCEITMPAIRVGHRPTPTEADVWLVYRAKDC